MFFVPGAGQFVVEPNNASLEYYDHVFDDVIAEGIPVFAAQPLEANDSSLEREALLVCVMTWAKTLPAEDGWSRSEDGLIGDGAIIAGHSRGGAATNLLVNDFDDFVAMLPPMASYELSGPLTRATFSTPGATEAMPMVGTAGYTLCSAGEPGPTCPLYVGSFELSGTSPVVLEDTCPDGSALSLTVSDLDLELLQPAMGIADEGSDDAAFPAGALHLRGFVVVDGVSRTIRAVNEAPVFIDAKYPNVFAGDMTVGFSLPCGGDTVPVEVVFRFKGVDDLASRPWIAITTPAAVQCPKTVSLNAASGDPDDDLASVRWYVDDVLMAPTTTDVQLTTGHTLRAVARDSRGATRTATRTVACR